jgi:hypothetical protein
MAFISVSGCEPLGLRNQTLRILCARAKGQLADEGDHHLLDQAATMSGLDFELVEAGRRARMAAALIAVADAYREELLAIADPDELESSRAQVLGELSSYLKLLTMQE